MRRRMTRKEDLLRQAPWAFGAAGQGVLAPKQEKPQTRQDNAERRRIAEQGIAAAMQQNQASRLHPQGKSVQQLYQTKDADLSAREILSKYEYLRKDTKMPYAQKKKMIQQSNRAFGRIYKDIKNDNYTEYASHAMQLQNELQGQLKSGAAAAGFLDAFSTLPKLLSQKTKNPAVRAAATEASEALQHSQEVAKQAHPKYYQAGKTVGDLGKQAAGYMVAGGVLSKAGQAAAKSSKPILQKAVSLSNKNKLTKAATALGGQQLLDSMVMQPTVYAEAKAAGKSKAEIQKEMQQQFASDLLFNAAFSGGSALLGKLLHLRGKAVPEKLPLHETKKTRSVPTQKESLPKMEIEQPFAAPKTAAKEQQPLMSERLSRWLSSDDTAALTKEWQILQDDTPSSILAEKAKQLYQSEGKEAAQSFLAQKKQRREELNALLAFPTKKEAALRSRVENFFVRDLSKFLSVNGKVNQKKLKALSGQAWDEIQKSGHIGEDTRNRLFDTAFSLGEVSNEALLNQPLRDRLRQLHFSISAKDAKNIPDFNQKRKRYFGRIGGIDTTGKHIPIDTAYAELSEQFPEHFPADIFHPADQAERIFQVADAQSKRKYALSEVYGKEDLSGLEEGYSSLLHEMEEDMTYLQKMAAERQEHSFQKLLESDLRISPEQMTEAEVQQLHHALGKYEKLAEQEKRRTPLTEADAALLQKLLHGETTEAAIQAVPEAKVANIMKLYTVEKPLFRLKKAILDYKKMQNHRIAEEVSQAVGAINQEEWHDISPFRMSMLTQERILDRVVPNDTGKKIKQAVFAPIHENEYQRFRWLREQKERLQGLELDSKPNIAVTHEGVTKYFSESALVQYLGELKNSQSREAKQAIQEAEANLTAAQKRRIEAAISTFRDIYEASYQKINQTLIRNGGDPIGYIHDYFPHKVFPKPENPLEKTLHALGFDFHFDTLPTEIAGLTETFRPNKKWSGHLLQRKGSTTDFDALRIADEYLEQVSDVIFHMEDGKRLRAFENHIRNSVSKNKREEQLQEILSNEVLTDAEKSEQLTRLNETEMPYLGNYVTNLRSYTDMLLGKQHPIDRAFEKSVIGRPVYQIADKINSRLAANMVGGNIGSALTNIIPIVQGMSGTSMSSNVKGLKDAMRILAGGIDELADKSAFLQTRSDIPKLYRTKLEKFQNAIFQPMQIADEFATKATYRARFFDDLKKGMSEGEALQEADDWARRLFAGRDKGSVPTLFQSKVLRPITMFGLEVNNLPYYLKEIPAEHQFAVAKTLLHYFKLATASYVLNDVFEKLTGRRPALDPLGIANAAIGDFTGKKLNNILDIALGDGMTEEQPQASGAKATGNLAKNMAEQMPFGGLIGGGRIPINSAQINLPKIVGAVSDYASGEIGGAKAVQDLGSEAVKPLFYLLAPGGGAQALKSLKGVQTMMQGGKFHQSKEGEQLQYAVNRHAPSKWAQSALFGQWALPEGKQYLDGGKSLSVDATSVLRGMQKDFGTEPKTFLEIYQKMKQAEKAAKEEKKPSSERKAAMLQEINAGRLDAGEKERLYTAFVLSSEKQQQEYHTMKQLGLSYPQAAALQVNLQRFATMYPKQAQQEANAAYRYIQSMAVPEAQKRVLSERFASAKRFVPQEVEPTAMTEGYQKVSDLMSVDSYEALQEDLRDTAWEHGKRGAKSQALKAVIDANTAGWEQAQRVMLYQEFGVGKSYW